MKQDPILIKIEGVANSGKTTIGKLIETTLKEKGLNVEFRGDENSNLNYRDVFDKLDWSNKKVIIEENIKEE